MGAAALLALACSAVTAAQGAEGPPFRVFSHITARTLACLAETSRRQHGTVFTADSRNPNIVTSETHYFGLTRILRDFDPRTGTATYTILQKPGFASYAQVWNGIGEAIRACS